MTSPPFRRPQPALVSVVSVKRKSSPNPLRTGYISCFTWVPIHFDSIDGCGHLDTSSVNHYCVWHQISIAPTVQDHIACVILKHQSVAYTYRNIIVLLTSLISHNTNLVFIASSLKPEVKRMWYNFFIFSCKIYANRCDPNNSKILSYKHLNVRLLCTICLARNSALLAFFSFSFTDTYLKIVLRFIRHFQLF